MDPNPPKKVAPPNLCPMRREDLIYARNNLSSEAGIIQVEIDALCKRRDGLWSALFVIEARLKEMEVQGGE